MSSARAPRYALLAALADAARDRHTYLHHLPTLGPLQLVAECVRRNTWPAGIVSADRAPEFVRCVGSRGSANGKFSSPIGVVVFPTDEVAVVDSENRRVVVLSPELVFVRAFGSAGDDALLKGAVDAAIDNDGNLAVVTTNGHCVEVFSLDGTLLRRIGRHGGGAGELTYPYSITVSSRGQYVVSDWGNTRLVIFSSVGTFECVIDGAQPQRAEAAFGYPYGVAMTPDDEIMLCDADNQRLQLFRLDGTHVRSIDLSTASDRPQFSNPEAVAVDSADTFVVTDCALHNAQVISHDGQLLHTLGSRGSGRAQLRSPRGVAITAAGEIIISDTGNHRIQLWA